MYKRPLYQKVIDRMADSPAFIQVLAGPRQVGKTTLAHQVIQALPCPAHYASSDGYSLREPIWIEQQWEIGRCLIKESKDNSSALLVLDEIQKISYWPDTVKKLWDEDRANHLNLKVIILGSSPLLIQSGLGESLSGRFELIPIPHWSFGECHEAFGWDLEKYVYFGGYPAAATLIKDEARWARYIIDSLIETSISRDIMLMTSIHKPALLRRVFELGCLYTGCVVSYQKMLEQLEDAGNAATLAHYLDLLSKAGLLAGLQKFSMDPHRQKASSPKLQVLNTALTTAQGNLSFENTKSNQEIWQKLIESTIGAYLINSTFKTKTEIFYWKESKKSVDFILQRGETLIAIDVNTSQKTKDTQGIDRFIKKYKPHKTIFVGAGGIPVEEFLLTPLESWI